MKRRKVVDNECWKGTKENLNLQRQVYCEDFTHCKIALCSGVISLHADDLLKQRACLLCWYIAVLCLD